MLRHLLVGLVDQAIGVRLLSCDRRVEALALGPARTFIHEPIGGPWARRRMNKLFQSLSHQPPTIVHAFSHVSYRIAAAAAQAFDADLVLQVTSLADCEAIARSERPRAWRAGAEQGDTPRENGSTPRVRRFLAFSQPLVTALVEQVGQPAARVELIRPGILASKQVACFADPERIPTILCSSDLRRHSGVDRLIAALHLLRERGHSAMLFLLGQGPKEAVYRRTIRDRRLAPWITFVPPLGDPVQVMRGADLFVRPASATAFTADVLQAMGAGVVVVSARSSICDYLRDNETAVFCDLGNGDRPSAGAVESLASAIERLLTDRAGARRIAAGGMEFVRAHHPMSRMAERTAEVYRRLALVRTTLPLS